MSGDDNFEPIESIFEDIQCYDQKKKIHLDDHENFLRYAYKICRCHTISKKCLVVGVQSNLNIVLKC